MHSRHQLQTPSETPLALSTRATASAQRSFSSFSAASTRANDVAAFAGQRTQHPRLPALTTRAAVFGARTQRLFGRSPSGCGGLVRPPFGPTRTLRAMLADASGASVVAAASALSARIQPGGSTLRLGKYDVGAAPDAGAVNCGRAGADTHFGVDVVEMLLDGRPGLRPAPRRLRRSSRPWRRGRAPRARGV
jgi:hypothetical protein